MDRSKVAIPMATLAPDFESMPLEELRAWSAQRICEADPRVLRARGTKDGFTGVLFVRITWRPEAKRALSHEPLLSGLRRTLARWAPKDWLVVVTDEPPVPPARRRTPTTEPLSRSRVR